MLNSRAMMDFSTRLLVPEAVIYREIAGEAVLLNLDSEAYFGLDETGVDFWSKLTEAASIEEAYNDLLAEYNVEPAELSNDLEAFVSEMIEQGLLERAT